MVHRNESEANIVSTILGTNNLTSLSKKIVCMNQLSYSLCKESSIEKC